MGRKAERWLADVYNAVRRRLGKEAVPESRKARLRAVYPGELPEKKARELDGRRLLQAVLCLGVFALLTAAALLASGDTRITELARPAEGTVRTYRLEAEGEWGVLELEVPVEGRPATPEEREQLFAQAEEEARQQVLGENTSLDSVWAPLDFQVTSSVPGMMVWWTPQDPQLIGGDGTLQAEEIPAEGISTALVLSLYWEGGTGEAERRQREVPVRLVPREQSGTEALAAQAEQLIREADREAWEEDAFPLPDQVDGKPVVFRTAGESPVSWELLALGALAAAFLFFREEQQLKEGVERRNRQLLLDYGRLVENLSVLMGAGLPVRRAWERILRDNRKKEGRSLYEEMALTLHAMEQGVSEEQAYGDFGRRCGLPPYLRLGSLLETNGRSGTKGLAALLEREAADAFQERLQMARRQGEEVSSRLLFPMIVLFGLVLALLMIPAVLTF